MHGRRALGRIGAIAGIALLAGCSGSPGAAPTPTSGAAVTIAPTAAAVATTSPSTAPLLALALLWEKSGPTQPDPCCETWWPAVDPKTGDIWVADSFASQFWIFAPDGTFKAAWGTPGSGQGQFDFSAHRHEAQSVGAIAFAPDATFFVADAGNQRIQKFDAKRQLLKTWGAFGSADGQFANPFGIVTDGKTVYVADDDRGDIQAFDTDGTFLRVFGPVILNAGIFMAIDPAGTLYRAAGEDHPSSILRYAADGTVAATIDTGVTDGFVAGIAVGPNGTLFVNIGYESNPGHALVELDATGKQLGLWSTGGETGVVDPDGKAIYLASNAWPAWPAASLRKYALP